MKESDLELLHSLANLFRHAIEKTDTLPAPLDRFPKGSCGEASLLLAQWLWEHGFESRYYCGVRTDLASHAWLEIDDMIVDITVDQFPEFPYPVYVGSLTPFHVQFSKPAVEQELKHGFHDYDPRTVSRLTSEYREILASM